MKKVYYAGIDYHKRYSVVCIRNHQGDIVREATVRPNSLEQFTSLFAELDGPVKVVYECGTLGVRSKL